MNERVDVGCKCTMMRAHLSAYTMRVARPPEAFSKVCFYVAANRSLLVRHPLCIRGFKTRVG